MTTAAVTVLSRRTINYIFPLLLISTLLHFSNLTQPASIFFYNVYNNQQLPGTKNLPEVCLLHTNKEEKYHSLLGGENLCHLGSGTEKCVQLIEKLNSPWTPQTFYTPGGEDSWYHSFCDALFSFHKFLLSKTGCQLTTYKYTMYCCRSAKKSQESLTILQTSFSYPETNSLIFPGSRITK